MDCYQYLCPFGGNKDIDSMNGANVIAETNTKMVSLMSSENSTVDVLAQKNISLLPITRMVTA